jgi:hypothetical protein
LQTLTIFHSDNAVTAYFIHRFCDQFADVFIRVCRDSTYLSDGFGISTWYRQFFQLFNRSNDSFVDTTFQIHWVHTSSNGFQAFGDDRLSQYSCSGSTVTRSIICLRSHFFNHLCAHVLEFIFQLNLFRHRNTIFSDGWCAE